MNTSQLILTDPPELSNKSASEILDFLYELATAFENHYGNQLRRYQEPDEPPELDLFEDFDDELPTF